MKKQFLSKPVPRGPRTIWRYLSALILLFSLSINQMWGAAVAITGQVGGTTAAGGSVKIHENSDSESAICKFENSWSSGANFYLIKTTGGFKSGDVVSFTGAYNNKSAKNAKLVIYAADKTTSLYTSASDVVNGRTSADDPTPESYTLTSDQDSLFLARDGNTGLFLLTLTVTRSSGGGSDPEDPTFVYVASTYTIGDPALDLSTVLSSNSSGAITFAVSTSDAGTTGANIANGKNFTATTAGTATITVSQAAATGYNAKTQDITVTVVAGSTPIADNLYFYFFKAEDATTNGVTNSDKFASMASSGSDMSGSITIDGNSYSVTRRTGDNSKFGEFTVSANKKATFYALAVSSGDGARKLKLERKSDSKSFVIDVAGGSSSYKSVSADNIPTGTYEIKRYDDSKVRLGMVAIKEVDATYFTASFDVDGGSEVASQSVLENDTVVKPADPTKSGNDFAGWVVKSTGAAYTWSTPVTAAVELKATWTPQVTKYKVAYYDGSTKVGEEEVVENASPVNYANYQTKALHSFTNWKNNAGAVIDPASLVVTKDTALYAHWAKVYIAQDANYVFENTTTVGTAPNAITVTKDNKPNEIAADSRIDNMWLSAMSVKLEDGTYPGSGDDFYGWKINTSGATIRFYVENDCRVTVTVGNLSSGLNITYTGKSAAEPATTALTAKQANNYDVKGGSLVTLTTAGSKTVTLKGIAVGDIPPLSDDASLSDLTLKYGTAEAATISGFASTEQIYYVEAPYGTAKADLPIVGATATDANALVTINQAKDREDWKTVIRVQAEDRIEAHDMYYEVRFKVQPKLGVEIIKAVTTTANDGDATGYIGGTYKNTKTGNAVKLDKNNHFGLVIAANNAFQEGDIFAMNITAAAGGNMGTMKIYESTDATEPLFESTEIGTVGMNYWTLPASVNGKTSLYIKRGGGDDWNPTFSSIAVYRLMAPFIEEFEIEGVEDFVIDQENKTITASVASTFDVTSLTPTVKYWGNGGGAIDKTGAQNFTNPVAYTVSSAYAEDATGDYAPVTYTVTINKVAPSVAPTITTQPQGANYVEGASIAALTVVAESAAGELSYQWQVKNGLNYEDIDGATAASYTPAVSAIGSYTYRVVVTNTEESKPATSVNSNDATIAIAADPACATFAEAGIPTEEPYQYTNTGEWTLYNANSSGKRDGGNNIFTDVKDFEGNNVKGFQKQRVVMIFEKDMKQIRIYAAECERTWAETDPIKVSNDYDKFVGDETPAYTADAATTSVDASYATDGKCRVFIANGEFLAGKVYLFNFSNSIKGFKVCAVEADPLADAPVFSGALSDEAICPGNAFTTLDATASPVTSYAWYKDEEAIEGATAATYTPTAAGTYYCIATNSATGYRDNSTKSAEAVLSVKAATAITTAPVSQRGEASAEVSLNVVAAGAGLEYAWYTCSNEAGDDAVALGQTGTSINVTITENMSQWYKVVVTGDCGEEFATALVEEWHEVAQADVTGSVTWNFDKSNLNLSSDVVVASTMVLANASNTMPNNANFRSDMLVALVDATQTKVRASENGGCYQGDGIKFRTTVPGFVTVKYRGTGNSADVTLTIGSETLPTYHGDWTISKKVFVPAGEVEITSVGTMRVKEIVFNATPDYTRNVSNNIGTLCVDHNVPAGQYFGATFYQIAGRNATYPDKLDFDQVAPDEELKAGEPYIFQSTTGRIDLFYGETEKTEPVVVNGMHGLLANGHLDIDDDNKLNILYISGNKLHNCSNLSSLTLVANRAYIVMSEVDATTSQPAPGRVRLTIGGNSAPQITTGMDNLNATDTPVKVLINGQIFILRGEKMYDVTGKLVK